MNDGRQRAAALVANVISWDERMEEVHDPDYYAGHELKEQAQDEASEHDRQARDALIEQLAREWREAESHGPIAIVMPDGAVVAYCNEGDGLLVSRPWHVLRLDR